MNTDYPGSHYTDHDQQIQHLSPLPDNPNEPAPNSRQEEERNKSPLPLGPLLASDIPNADLSVDFSMFTNPSEEAEKVEKRKSNLLKLNEENEKLQRELKAMTERLEAAERRRTQLQARDEKSGDSE